MMDHLTPNAAELLDKSPEERIFKINSDSWIGYSQANRIIDKLNDLLVYPISIRMPNLLIVGDTNNGKTHLVNRFFKSHLPIILPDSEKLVAKVLYIQAPPQPDEKKFFNALLESLNAPYKISDKLEAKQSQAFSILRRLETRILIIDEIHNILAGSMSRQRVFLNVIKYLSNELRISIVAAGTQDALNAINTDYQLSNRFEPLILPKWQYDNEYLRLLSSFERVMPLKKPSNLIQEELSMRILSISQGTIGEISKVISLASIEAIKSGVEFISKDILDAIDYTPPSERRNIASKLL